MTADLGTLGYRLSFWKCASDEIDGAKKVALAIVAASDNIETTYVVWIPTSNRQADGLGWNESKVRAPVADLTNLHLDVCHLVFRHLGRLAERVRQAVHRSRCKRLSRTQLAELFANAAANCRIQLKELRTKVRTYCGLSPT